MQRKVSVILAALVVLFSLTLAAAAEKELSRGQILDVAVKAAEQKGIVLKDVDIVYDEENDRWEERMVYIKEDTTPNRGIFDQGYSKKYQAILLDFEETAPTKDVWVFVDRETGEVVTFFEEK